MQFRPALASCCLKRPEVTREGVLLQGPPPVLIVTDAKKICSDALQGPHNIRNATLASSWRAAMGLEPGMKLTHRVRSIETYRD